MSRNKWTLERFIQRGNEVHGGRYDYSQIRPEHINGYRSKVPITCNVCKYSWTPCIDDHINSKSGCLSCSGREPWTLERFLTKAKELNGDNFNYDAVTREHIKNSKSKVPVKCNLCNYEWTPIIANHIHIKQGCPNCEGNARITYERFVTKTLEKHENSFDCSKISPKDIKNNKSRIIVTCNKCKYEWNTSIDHFLSPDRGCPDCSGHARWDLKRFLLRASEIHDNVYDYSLITEEHVQHSQSQIPIRCRCCVRIWYPTIKSHITAKEECPNCKDRGSWTLERLLVRGHRLHGDRYDYSLIHPGEVMSSLSKIPIRCNTCWKIWRPTINNHINNGTGCPKCIKSKGELECETVFKKYKIEYFTEYVVPGLNRRYYDFMFKYQDKQYLLEFDGIQHFKKSSMFKPSDEDFEKSQKRDITKTHHAVKSGFYLIRIDHTQLGNVEFHIRLALQHLSNTHPIYWSNPPMYEYIITALEIKKIQILF